MKTATRKSLAFNILLNESLPEGVLKIARGRARGILTCGAASARLVDLLAAAYLLGVEDAGDALETAGVHLA